VAALGHTAADPARVRAAADAGATLFTDSKARRVNDIVTILVSESSQASKAATTETTREARMEADISQFFGLEQRYAARNDFFDPTAIIRANAVNDFKGEGATTRNDQLTGTMTAVVQRVLPNGNLVIKGRRAVAVNDESQYMVLPGIIRPEDISPENAIASSLVADARITYHGVGVVSDKQSNGWASKIFDWIWPL